MNSTLTWRLALRYLRGRRSANAAPILSRISMVAIAVSSCALIIILSVVNGLETLVKGMYNDFYPDIKISAARGKFFSMDEAALNNIAHLNGVQYVTPVIEDNVLANNSDQQKVIVLKGITNNYFNVNNIRQYIVQGVDSVSAGDVNTAITGFRIMNELGTDVNTLSYIMLYYPDATVSNPGADLMGAFRSLRLHPSGVFKIQDDFDSKYVLAPLPAVQELFHEQGKYSSIEIKGNPDALKDVKRTLQHELGDKYKVESRFEQNRTLYMVMGAEKWAVYAILVLVLLIATFNMIGALSMLVLEKQKDIAILKAMGALPSAIRRIFLLEGILWSLAGGLFGVILGCGICLAQQQYGFVKLGGGSFLMDAYPVEIRPMDIVLVLFTVLAVGLLISWYPAYRSTRTFDPTLKSA